jgi:alkylated DNA nucleotide flippase Atl1
MRGCSDASVPCHRVIAAGGKIGGYGRDVHAKRTRLAAEGIEVSRSTIRDFADRRWVQQARITRTRRAR